MKKKEKRYFAVSPYLYHLIIVGIVGIFLCTVLTIFFLFAQSGYSLYTFWEGNKLSLAIVLCPLLVFFSVCIKNSYEYFGYVEITDSKLICYAPFKKPLVFEYSEITEIGIDYVWLSVSKQFWIYIGVAQIPNEYCHRINRLALNQNHVRIQFSEQVFTNLLNKLPNDLRKRLYRSKTADVH